MNKDISPRKWAKLAEEIKEHPELVALILLRIEKHIKENQE